VNAPIKRGRGRVPATGQVRGNVLFVRLDDAEVQAVRDAAERAGLPAAEWARQVIAKAVRARPRPRPPGSPVQ
jgi:hypothetical protein